MVKVLIVIAIVALLVFVVFGQYVGVRNTLVTKNEAVKARVVAGGHRAATPRRPDSQPGGNGEGFRPAGSTVFGDIANARSALLSAQRRRTRSPPTDSWMALSAACWSWWRIIRS